MPKKFKTNIKKVKQESFLKSNYKEAFVFLKKSKAYIITISIIFVAFAILGFFNPSYIPEYMLKIIKELVGHGVGKAVHENPEIPNWGSAGQGLRLKKGMVIAIEPMVAIGSSKIIQGKDGWSWKTKDGSNAAHFEHTVVVEKNGALILTK